MFVIHRRLWFASALLAWMIVGGAGTARADIFHLKGGDILEGEVLEDLGEAYRIRTFSGIVDIEKDRIVKREKAPSPWRLYRKKLKGCPNTAEGNYKLALWCRKHELRSEEVDHLEKAIALEPNHAAARDALGYIKEKGDWVKPPPPNAPSEEEREARRAAQEEERLLRKLISEWFGKVRAIHRRGMAKQTQGMRSEKFRAARDHILAIRDPAALPVLAEVLTAGNTPTRRVLVEALAQFEEDEATKNLVVITLLDPSPEVRRLAARKLVDRCDDRVIASLRQSLRSKEECLLRNAAEALGILKTHDAFEDLVSVLSTQRLQRVRESQMIALGTLRQWRDSVPIVRATVWRTFGRIRLNRSGRRYWYFPLNIGCYRSGVMVGTETAFPVRMVSVHRTEVQEALIAITGQNFGFDADAWLRWRRQQDE